MKNLLNVMDVYVSRMEELLQTIEEKLKTIPYVDKLMEIKGIGLITVSGFIAEVGDIDVLIIRSSCRSWRDMQSWQMIPESTMERAGSATEAENG